LFGQVVNHFIATWGYYAVFLLCALEGFGFFFALIAAAITSAGGVARETHLVPNAYRPLQSATAQLNHGTLVPGARPRPSACPTIRRSLPRRRSARIASRLDVCVRLISA
jgi:hypothetical protein